MIVLAVLAIMLLPSQERSKIYDKRPLNNADVLNSYKRAWTRLAWNLILYFFKTAGKFSDFKTVVVKRYCTQSCQLIVELCIKLHH